MKYVNENIKKVSKCLLRVNSDFDINNLTSVMHYIKFNPGDLVYIGECYKSKDHYGMYCWDLVTSRKTLRQVEFKQLHRLFMVSETLEKNINIESPVELASLLLKIGNIDLIKYSKNH